MKRRSIWRWGVLALLAAVAVGLAVWRPSRSEAWRLVVTFDPAEAERAGTPVARLRDQAAAVLRRRCEALGIAETEITPLGDNRLAIHVPDLAEANRSTVRDRLLDSAKLEFYRVDPQNDRQVAEFLADDGTFVPAPGYQPRPHVLETRTGDRTVRKHLFLAERPEDLGNADVKQARATLGAMGDPQIAIALTPRGTAAFAEVTKNNVGRQLAIVMANTVYSAPNIRTAITDGKAVITGDFSAAEACRLANLLAAEALPVALRIESEGTE